MEHARKLMLVDPANFDVRNVKRHYTLLDQSISDVLDRRDVDARTKLQLYQAAVNKFLLNKQNVENERKSLLSKSNYPNRLDTRRSKKLRVALRPHKRRNKIRRPSSKSWKRTKKTYSLSPPRQSRPVGKEKQNPPLRSKRVFFGRRSESRTSAKKELGDLVCRRRREEVRKKLKKRTFCPGCSTDDGRLLQRLKAGKLRRRECTSPLDASQRRASYSKASYRLAGRTRGVQSAQTRPASFRTQENIFARHRLSLAGRSGRHDRPRRAQRRLSISVDRHRRLFQIRLRRHVEKGRFQERRRSVHQNSGGRKTKAAQVANGQGQRVRQRTVPSDARRTAHTVLRQSKQRHQSQRRRTIQSHAENQDVEILHASQHFQVRRHFARHGPFVQSHSSQNDRQSTDRRECRKRRPSYERMYGDQSRQRPVKPKLEVGQKVRISKTRRTFDKGYLPN